MRRVVALAVVVLAAGLAVALGRGGATSPPHLSLLLDWTPNADHVAILSARDRGFFAKRGLGVDVHAPSDPTDPLKLVGVGRADLGVSYEQELYAARAKGLPVVAVAAIVPRPLNSLMWLDNRIHGARDLAGRSVGITGVASDTAILDTILARAHVDPSRVKTMSVGYDLLPALLAHRVDAVLGVYPNVEGVELAQRGRKPHVLRVDQGGVPPYDELLLVASSDRLAHDSDYRAAVRGAVAAIDAGGRWAQAHPAGAAAIVRKASGQAAAFVDASTRATLRLVRQRGGSTCLHPAAWRAFGAWLAARRLVPHPVAAGDVMTTRYLPKSCAG